MKKRILTWMTAVLSVLCLAILLTVGASAAEEKIQNDNGLRIAYGNLVFKDTVYLRYAVSTETYSADGMVLLVWTEAQNGQNGYKYGTQNEILTSSQVKEINGEDHAIFDYKGLTAKQMTDYVYARAYIPAKGNEPAKYGKVVKYSVLQYSYQMLGKIGNNATDEQALIELLEAMLDYGAAAQKYMKYKTDWLANDDFYLVEIKGGHFRDGFTQGLFRPGHKEPIISDLTGEETEIEVSNENTEVVLPIYSEGLVYSSYGNGTCYVSGIGVCRDANVVIPPVSPAGERVTRIKNETFSSCDWLISVTIPEGVTSIGDYAFKNSRNLTNVVIPDSMQSIGKDVFYGCTNLIEIENGVEYVDKWAIGCVNGSTTVALRNGTVGIAYAAFADRDCLTSITIPESMKYIEEYAFSGCTALERINYNAIELKDFYDGNYVFYHAGKNGKGIEVVVGAKVVAIPTRLFSPGYSYNPTSYDYSPKIVSVRFEEGSVCQIIHGSAFAGCRSLTSVQLPDGLKSIDGSAFSGCSSLTSLRIPESVTNVVNGWCVGGAALQLENGVYYVDKWAVGHDGKVTNAVLRKDTVGISDFAFECYSLTSIVIPISVKYIGNFTFDGIEPAHIIGDIYYAGTRQEWEAISWGFCNATLRTATIHYNSALPSQGLLFTSNGDGTCYVSGLGGCTDTDVMVPAVSPAGDKVTGVGYYAFVNCTTLTSIKFPEPVSLGWGAFSGCTNLKRVDIPGGVIPTYEVFMGCSSLESITISDLATGIGESAFYYCSSLKELTIPASLTNIRAEAVMGCSGLEKITVKEGNPVFHSAGNCLIETATQTLLLGCRNSVIPTDGTVTSIAPWAFSNCQNLISLTIPATVTNIGDSAFRNCSNLKSIVIPESITRIGSYTFDRCSQLTDLCIPDSVTSIGAGAFSGCTSLIKVQGGVSYVGKWIVSCKDNFTSVILRTDTVGISDDAFSYCHYLTGVTIPASVKHIGKHAFYYCNGLTSLTISDGVENIGEHAFAECSRLTYLEIPASIVSIGDMAFRDCTSLKRVKISGGVTSFGSFVFQDCSQLEHVEISDGLESIGNYTFRFCGRLASIVIPKSVTSIGANAFANCNRLINVYYSGTEEEWKAISIDDKGNSALENVVIHYNYDPETP